MLVPNNTAVILIASQVQSRPAPQMLEGFHSGAQRLINAAHAKQIPMIAGRFPAVAANCDLPADLSRDPITLLPFHPKPETWATTEFGQAIAAASRNQVVIAGFWLEEAVTLLALNCLVVGYDTYLAGDATPPVDAALEPAARARLAQAGVVPTSIDQVIREWAALHDDPVQAG